MTRRLPHKKNGAKRKKNQNARNWIKVSGFSAEELFSHTPTPKPRKGRARKGPPAIFRRAIFEHDTDQPTPGGGSKKDLRRTVFIYAIPPNMTADQVKAKCAEQGGEIKSFHMEGEPDGPTHPFALAAMAKKLLRSEAVVRKQQLKTAFIVMGSQGQATKLVKEHTASKCGRGVFSFACIHKYDYMKRASQVIPRLGSNAAEFKARIGFHYTNPGTSAEGTTNGHGEGNPSPVDSPQGEESISSSPEREGEPSLTLTPVGVGGLPAFVSSDSFPRCPPTQRFNPCPEMTPSPRDRLGNVSTHSSPVLRASPMFGSQEDASSPRLCASAAMRSSGDPHRGLLPGRPARSPLDHRTKRLAPLDVKTRDAQPMESLKLIPSGICESSRFNTTSPIRRISRIDEDRTAMGPLLQEKVEKELAQGFQWSRAGSCSQQSPVSPPSGNQKDAKDNIAQEDSPFITWGCAFDRYPSISQSPSGSTATSSSGTHFQSSVGVQPSSTRDATPNTLASESDSYVSMDMSRRGATVGKVFEATRDVSNMTISGTSPRIPNTSLPC